jgi:hypothetical protein
MSSYARLGCVPEIHIHPLILPYSKFAATKKYSAQKGLKMLLIIVLSQNTFSNYVHDNGQNVYCLLL